MGGARAIDIHIPYTGNKHLTTGTPGTRRIYSLVFLIEAISASVKAPWALFSK
jgi:hypothetical protein